MISIHSAEENEFIRNYVEEQPSSQTTIWIGLKRNVYDGFGWLDKSPVDYDNWDSDRLDNTGCFNRYIEMQIYKNDYKHPFVCGFNCKLSIKISK